MQNKRKHKMFKFLFYLESCQLVSSVYHSSLLSKLWYTGCKQESLAVEKVAKDSSLLIKTGAAVWLAD